MPAKAIDARKRLDRNRRFRGHGPLLQKRCPFQRQVAHQPGDIQGPPLVGTPRGQAAAGRQAREAAMGRSYKNPWHVPTTGGLWPLSARQRYATAYPYRRLLRCPPSARYLRFRRVMPSAMPA